MIPRYIGTNFREEFAKACKDEVKDHGLEWDKK